MDQFNNYVNSRGTPQEVFQMIFSVDLVGMWELEMKRKGETPAQYSLPLEIIKGNHHNGQQDLYVKDRLMQSISQISGKHFGSKHQIFRMWF